MSQRRRGGGILWRGQERRAERARSPWARATVVSNSVARHDAKGPRPKLGQRPRQKWPSGRAAGFPPRRTPQTAGRRSRRRSLPRHGGRQAVHEDGVLLGQAHQVLVDLIGLEQVVALGGLSSPIETQASDTTQSAPSAAASASVVNVTSGLPAAQSRVSWSTISSRGLATFSRKPNLTAACTQIGQHIVAVAAPADGGAGDVALVLLEGHHIRHHLAGMGPFGQAVDHRDGGVGRQFLDHFVIQQADHHGIDIARNHPRGVGDGFLARQLHLVAVSIRAEPPSCRAAMSKLMRGAGALLVEDHGQHLASMGRSDRRRPWTGRCVHPCAGGHRDDRLQGGAVMIRHVEKMLRPDFSGAFIGRLPCGLPSRKPSFPSARCLRALRPR